IIDSVRGERSRRHWIVFDGDVDPEWVENLNSVLDDNRLLTLPNGERLALPGNVRVMFEVETLRYATPATVSRCGMVWFGGGTVTFDMATQHFLRTLRAATAAAAGDAAQDVVVAAHAHAATVLEPLLAADGLVAQALAQAEGLDHVMEFSQPRALGTLFALVGAAVRELAEYNAQHADFPLAADAVEAFLAMRLAVAVVWSFAGDTSGAARRALSDFVRGAAPAAIAAEMPAAAGGSDDESLLDVDVELRGGAAVWVRWAQRVPHVDVEPHRVADADVVIPTPDTLRLESVLGAWVAERRPVVLCGPPGSGKTMTLLAALRQLPDVEVAALNFSSATGPDLVRRALEQHCEYRRTPGGTVLAPMIPGRWLVVFCDEVNLPAADTYGTQRVIAFVRGLVERG
ncbi:dynein heavy chain, partial [Coemansia nantahalensis]